MRIGIDCRTILDETAREKAGVAHYTYYLVRNLLRQDRESEYVLFFEDKVSPALLREIGNWGGKVSIQKFHFSQYKRYLPYVYSHLFIANQIQKAKLDVFHSPANIVPLRLLATARRPKIVATVHDLAIYRHPEWFPKGQGFSIKYLVPKTIQQVDRLIVPSQATARDLQELFHVSPEKITVIPHGVEERFFRKTVIASDLPAGGERGNLRDSSPRRGVALNDMEEDYILFVGTLEPRKNLVRLIAAYAGLPAEILAKYDLVLAGQPGWKYQQVSLEIKNLKLEIRNKVKLLGYFPGKNLPRLMQNAAVFVYPSLYEGFGLPVLEAMAAGCPVVTSRVGSLPEVTGEAAVLVDPVSVSDLTAQITKVIRDVAYQREISAAGVKRAREFTWEKAALATFQVYERIFSSASVISH